MSNLPERINVIKTVTYDVPAILDDIKKMGMDYDIQTVDDVMEFIEDWVADDFGGLWNLVFQDENGESL
jgi:hypothetical protein